jgi:hypothetical protein
MTKYWSAKEDRYVRKWYRRKLAEEIGRVLHRSMLSIRGRARILKCSKAPRPMTRGEESIILRSYKNKSIYKISQQMNRAPARIYELLKREGLSAPSKRPWTKEENKLVKQLYTKVKKKQLATRLDRTVYSIFTHGYTLGLARLSVKKRSRKRSPKKKNE